MSKKQKKTLVRIIVSACLFLIAITVEHFTEQYKFIPLIILAASYIIIGYDILKKAFLNIIHGHVFDENFLMCVATIGAVGTGQYSEAVAVMLFYQVGEFFQSYAVGKTRRSVSELMDIRPDSANVFRDGELSIVSPEEVIPGEIIHVKPGERIPLDGVIVSGETTADTSALTGESKPKTLRAGDEVLSGCINLSGLIKVRVTKEFGSSTVAKILDLVENSSAKKAKSENFITKFSAFYTPAVVISAVLLAVLPPLISGGGAEVWKEWINRALTFLVISCPCALVISVPLSFFSGLGGASKNGILIKGGNYVETLAKTGIVVFDKTGTLTKGVFNVTSVYSERLSKEELLKIAAYAETFSNHPIAVSIKNAYGKEINESVIDDYREISGRGVTAVIAEKQVAVGNNKLMDSIGVNSASVNNAGTTVHVAVNGEYAGYLIISDEIKEDSAAAVASLKKAGIQKTVMLTGDDEAVGNAVAAELGLDEVHSKLLPEDKVRITESLLGEKNKKSSLMFVGDGINDAPVLSIADVGVAMGAIGSDAAIEAADVVLMDDKPSKIAIAIKTAKRTMSIVRQNIVFSLVVKFAILILGALGKANMWLAVFADVGVAVIAVLNAMRALKTVKGD